MRGPGLCVGLLLLAVAPASAPAESPIESPAVVAGTLRVLTTGGREVADGGRIDGAQALTFAVNGTPQRYLYLVESGGGSLSVIHPPPGQVLPSGEPATVRPQPTSLNDDEVERAGWTPAHSGAIEYLLVESPAPRSAPSDSRLSTLEQLLAPPPYVQGPMGEAAVVVARVSITRDPPEDPAP